MAKTITATFEDGVLKPLQPLNLPPHTQVRVIIEELGEDTQKQKQEKLSGLENLWRISKIHAGERLTREQLHERR